MMRTVLFTAALAVFCLTARAYHPFQDTTRPTGVDTLHYPIHDRRGDPFSSAPKSAIDLKDPANINDSVVYDAKTKQYYIIEKIGTHYYRKPTYLTFDEFTQLQARKSENDYFQKRANVISSLNKKLLQPRMKVTDHLFNRLFGNGKIEIRPQGNINIMAGYEGQRIENPALPERSRRTGNFAFNEDAQISVIGNIGDKLKLPISYNTLANTELENQLKLDYRGYNDEIIKSVEAGNVSFSSKGSLIPGAQQLFGIKTQLQFGKLFVTGVLANQRSQRQSVALTGSSTNTSFELRADDYEENRHFLMAQYFHDNFNAAMHNLPVINSRVQILRLEVWVTNRNGSTTDTRDVVGLMDLGENKPFNPNIQAAGGNQFGLSYNDANTLYRSIINDPASRNSSFITTKLGSLGLQAVQDYEKTYGRKLNSSEYSFNSQIGYLSLNQPLQPDEVLAVAYQYTANGKTYQVGEFSQDVTPDTTQRQGGTQKVLFLKLLKATSQRTNLPLWKLMMKNVYVLKTKDGSFLSSIQPGDFNLNVLYEQPSLGQKRYLPAGNSQLPLINLLNLDRLNSRNDPLPDGRFDYVEGFTVVSAQARIIFPTLEPFGRDLEYDFTGPDSAVLRKQYLYYPLYDTIKEIAKTFANLDRYIISGTAKGQSTSEISLGAYNVPPGSVIVTSGGRTLKENVDFTVDYNLGTVKIINQALINSGVPVNVQYENNATYGIQQRNYMALRLDYLAKSTARESLNIGASVVRLGERPFFSKVSISDGDPIRNTMYGVDFNYRTDAPRITRLLDKLPFYHTTEASTITAYGEAAYLKPGHPPQIGKGRGGLIYIDDFEGSSSAIDLRFPLVSWGLSSTPAGNGLFPEATLRDSLPYGFNRGKLAWYNIEPVLQDKKGLNNPLRTHIPGQGLDAELTDPRVRAITVTQIYPNRTPDYGQAQLITFDMAFYPGEKGPYNFNDRAGEVTADGRLRNPRKAWGGIMRGLDQVDFESANVEFIEFWLQDPFLKNPSSTGGQLYFDLGNVSEDVLKDGKRFFENGISGANTKALEDSSTVWGKAPANPIQVTRAFSNDPADRPRQDAGFDGLDDDAERRKFAQYLSNLQSRFGAGSAAFQKAQQDPSSDDFKNYRDGSYDQSNAGILQRYKNVNNPQGNSPVASANDQYVSAFTLYPDQEEFNNDNTLNELEEYFEYKVDLAPAQFAIGKNFITDIRSFTPSGGMQEKWYLFRIPIKQYSQKVGQIPDFKSIRFIRMYLTGFEDSVVLRFAKLELVRNQWRRFDYEVDTTGNYTRLVPTNAVTFNQLPVNVEENSSRNPIPYRIPPGVQRQQQLSNNNVNVLLNEQALSLQVCGLPRGESRGVYKTLNLDLRRYGKLQMYVHAESVKFDGDINDNDLYAVLRLGNDLASNYYEIRIPLKITRWAGATAETIWPMANDLDLALDQLTALKVRRNNTGSSTRYFRQLLPDGKELAILGNPNLGEVRSFFLGVENRNKPSACTEVWFNELRLGELNEKGAWAATGRVDVKLADLGTLYVSAAAHSTGWGTLEQRVNERAKDNLTQLDMATSLELGKLLPAKAGMSIPVYASYSKTVSTPEFDPYDLDLKLKDKLKGAPSNKRDSIRQDAIDIKTIKTVNFTNVKRNNIRGKKQRIWSVENFDVSYSFYREQQHNPLIENNEVTRHRAGLGYNYVSQPKYLEPVKPYLKSRSAWLALLKDFNINPMPSLLGFRADVNRQFGAFRPRNVGGPKGLLPESYDKYFTFDRIYNLRWDLTKSFNIDFSATNKAWVDEDSGRLDKQARRRMWDNFWKGGRTISYQQTATFTYTLPTAKIPLLDWTTVRANYNATYNWIAASLLARTLGNTLSNTQTRGLTGEFDFTKLYSKSRWLRALEDNGAGGAPSAPPPKADTSKGKKRKGNEPLQLSGPLKFAGRILTGLKNIRVEYTESSSASIYGYTDSTHELGMNFRSMAPGLGFVFGHQPDTNFINKMGQKGLLTHDPNFNYQNRQDFNQKLHIAATVIPVRDLTIDLFIDKSFGKAYSELYKDTTGHSGFSRLSPYSSGSFSVSYIAFQTLFEKTKLNEVSATFLQFQQNRQTVSQRLGKQNPYSNGQQTGDGYYKGYGKYAQDVILPAFLAAYTKRDPNAVSLVKENNPNVRFNPFSGILPKPNWQVTYTGLSRIPALQKIFSNFTISHGYNGMLSMNSFTSSLLFNDPLRVNYPGFIDTLTGNFIPYFLVPNISISEQFVPLISIDVQTISQMTARFEYKKSRTLSLSLIDYQLSEARATEYTIGAGWRKRGVFSFLRWKGKPLSNDANFRLDLSMRDESTSNNRLDQTQALTTAGQKIVFINPSIDYVISNRVNLKLFYERRRVEPKISTSPPITTTRAGLQVRISLQ